MEGISTLDELPYFTADSSPYGETYGHWTVKWWQWCLSTPKPINPAVDKTGEYTNINNRTNEVWFLAGKVADENRNLPNRFCTIPAGKPILFPVINCEANPLEYPDLNTHQELLQRVNRDEDTIIKKECFVDGSKIPPQRVKSDPPVFELKIDADSIFNVNGSGSTYASSDGYWVFLKPLNIGQHIIHFEGACEYGKLNSGADYRIEVKPS